MSVLSPPHIQNLVRSGLASELREDGTRRVHRGFLTFQGRVECSDLPVGPGQYVPRECYVTIPELLISPATLRYIGFTSEKADAIFKDWESLPHGWTWVHNVDEQTPPFVEMALGPMRDTPHDTKSDNEQDWIDVMDKFGINKEIQRILLDKHFKHIRQDVSCLFFVQAIMEHRYCTLERIQEQSTWVEADKEVREQDARPVTPQHQ
ncbi:hypothetical protein AAL_03936 [Moelleriella libera RCEF 2490]|uniref:Uncharacterized protein n=1 Tax=Moelleriella libera RCEF 2490 TaxID=1081109 RepID=A0A168CKA7_9HYPO|nr:hypothetical protein AAL_03936 [Moelleriella libera RCEF 2490]